MSLSLSLCATKSFTIMFILSLCSQFNPDLCQKKQCILNHNLCPERTWTLAQTVVLEGRKRKNLDINKKLISPKAKAGKTLFRPTKTYQSSSWNILQRWRSFRKLAVDLSLVFPHILMTYHWFSHGDPHLLMTYHWFSHIYSVCAKYILSD